MEGGEGHYMGRGKKMHDSWEVFVIINGRQYHVRETDNKNCGISVCLIYI